MLKNIDGFKEFKSENVYLVSTDAIVKIPLTANFQQFNDVWVSMPGASIIGDTSQGNLIFCLLLNIVLISFSVFLFTKYEFKLMSLVLLGLLILINLFIYEPNTTPKPTSTLASLNMRVSDKLRLLTMHAKKVIDNTFDPEMLTLGPRLSTIPGTTNASADNDLELLTVSAYSVVPIHSHSSRVYALALNDGIELSVTGSTWRPWIQGEIINIPKGQLHTVRNVISTSVQILSTTESEVSAINDFLHLQNNF